jgi:O-antigen/teichoic acid export membrane protein
LTIDARKQDGRSAVALYAAANALRHLSSLIMVPLLTHALSPVEYGTIEILSIAILAASLITSIGIGDSVFRLLAEAASDAGRRSAVIGTLYAVALGASSVGAISVYLLAPWVVDVFDLSANAQDALRLFSLTIVLEAIAYVALSHLRERGHVARFVLASLTKLVAQVSLCVVLVTQMDLGVHGVIVAAVLSSAALVVVSVPVSLRLERPSINWDVGIDILKFGLAMSATATAAFALGYADKIVVSRVSGAAMLAQYSLAFKITLAYVAIALVPLHQQWEAHCYRLLAEDSAVETGQRVIAAFVAWILVSAAGATLLSSEVIRVLTPPSYWGSADAVAPLMVATTASAIGYVIRVGALRSGRQNQLAVIAWVSVGVLLLGLLLVVPRGGIVGAAWVCAVTSLGRLAVEYKVSRMGLPPFGYPRDTFILATACSAAALIAEVARHSFVTEPTTDLAISASLILAIIALAACLPIARDSARWILSHFGR